MQDRRLVDTERGRIAIGWLVVQDLLTVLALVLLPPLAGLLQRRWRRRSTWPGSSRTLGLTFGKVAAFVALMLLVGRRVIPAILHYIAHTGSRELFRLAVLSVALGVAFVAAELFGVSFALGAFFAGMVLSESAAQPARRRGIAAAARRLRRAVLRLGRHAVRPGRAAARDRAAAGAHCWWSWSAAPASPSRWCGCFGYPLATALMLGVGLAQIGEFSFILADLGIGLGLLPERARDLILGTSIVSIFANPILFTALERAKPWIERWDAKRAPPPPQEVAEEELPVSALRGHAVLVGYGRVGRLVCASLRREGWPLLVIEARAERAEQMRTDGIDTITGNAAQDRVLRAANLPNAHILMVAIPDVFEAGQIVEQARAANPGLEIIARAHSEAEAQHLMQHGASSVVMGEREIARTMLEHARERRALFEPGKA